MFERHPLFDEPGDDDRLWRYMSFGKFVSVLSRSSLYFCRVDRLQDRFEGRLPNPTYDITDPRLRTSYEQERTRSIINCWTLSQYESVALWNTYVPQGEGIVIGTTFTRLRNSLRPVNMFEEARVHIGRVRYVNFREFNFIGPGGTAFNGFMPLIHKRPFFQFESEVRALISGLGTRFLGSIIQQVPGLYVPVNLDKLIDEIRVAPGAPDWFVDAVRAVVTAFALREELVRRSDIDVPPRDKNVDVAEA